MRVEAVVAEDFFSDAAAVREWADQQEYRPIEGPDGVTYPGICPEIPGALLGEAVENVFELLGQTPVPKLAFLRLTTAGANPPHWAHTDAAVASRLLLVYLTPAALCRGGTVTLQHKATGMRANPDDEAGEATWRRDTNVQDAWRPVDVVAMRFNRGVIYPTDLFHAALPRFGFGLGPEDGRLVFTMFFDTKER